MHFTTLFQTISGDCASRLPNRLYVFDTPQLVDSSSVPCVLSDHSQPYSNVISPTYLSCAVFLIFAVFDSILLHRHSTRFRRVGMSSLSRQWFTSWLSSQNIYNCHTASSHSLISSHLWCPASVLFLESYFSTSTLTLSVLSKDNNFKIRQGTSSNNYNVLAKARSAEKQR